MILIFILYAVFSAMTFINSALMASNPYPLFVGMLRAIGSGVLLLTYCWFFRRQAVIHFKLSRSGWLDLLTYGVLIHAFVMCGFSYAAAYSDPISICFIVASGPFLTALIQYMQGREILTSKKILGLIVGSCGLLPILFTSGHHLQPSGAQNLAWWGNLVTFVSMFVFCYGWIVLKRFLKTHSYPLQIVNGVAMLVGGMVSGVLVWIVQGKELFSLSFSPDFSVLMLAFLASSLLTYMLYAHLLGVFSPTFISFAGFLEPAFGMIYGVVFWGYVPGWSAGLALVVLFLGLYIFYIEELKGT